MVDRPPSHGRSPSCNFASVHDRIEAAATVLLPTVFSSFAVVLSCSCVGAEEKLHFDIRADACKTIKISQLDLLFSHARRWSWNCPVSSPCITSWLLLRVLGKGFSLSYHSKETLLFAVNMVSESLDKNPVLGGPGGRETFHLARLAMIAEFGGACCTKSARFETQTREP